jgi:tRNA dimethylallyltransferase
VAFPLVAIVGPTASGKSDLALRLARAHAGEIVSCDSLQVHRGLDIGSAKATPEERAQVPHHLVDVVGPGDDFSAADYARLAREALRDIAARGRLPIVAGGSGLYLRALLQGLFEGPSRDSTLRARFEALAERFSDARLHRLLAHVDAATAAETQHRDRVRIVRALEVYWLTGRPISSLRSEGSRPLEGFRTLVLGLNPDRERLRVAVEARTRQMIQRGLVSEVETVLAATGGVVPRPLEAIGYRQAVAVLRGDLDLAGAERSIVADTMRFAKRQMTWFRHQAEVTWFETADEAHAAAEHWLAQPAKPW